MAGFSGHKPCGCLSLRQPCCNSTTVQVNLVNIKESPYTEKCQKMQRYVHCKLREFCKEASILKGYGTKNKCSVLFLKNEPIKTKRLKNYCKIDTLHSPSFASVTSLFFYFIWRNVEQMYV